MLGSSASLDWQPSLVSEGSCASQLVRHREAQLRFRRTLFLAADSASPSSLGPNHSCLGIFGQSASVWKMGIKP
jgi:hypothetical protein